MPTPRTAQVHFRAFQPSLQTRDLPAGICGRVSGIALVYGTEDAYGTMFAAGCLDRTKREKLKAGKVALFADHAYGIRTHVGVVRTLTTVGSEEELEADLFDTEDGRHAKAYLESVVASGAYTGFSIGFYNRTKMEIDDTDPENSTMTYTEVELEEVSITPRPAVPGADVVGVRNDLAAAWRLFDAAVAVLPVKDIHARLAALAQGDAKAPDTSDAGLPPVVTKDADGADDNPPADLTMVPVTWEQRRAAIAALYEMEIV